MKHIFYIDPIEKLNIKKDSSLFWALTLQKNGEDVYLLFDENLDLQNRDEVRLTLSRFKGVLGEGFYIESFEITGECVESIYQDKLYYRIDPPIDASYLRSAWMISALCKLTDSTTTNDPLGTIKYNEKLLGFEQSNSLPSLITSSPQAAKKFIRDHELEEFIMKPLNGFSGIGVRKLNSDQIENLDSYFGGEKLIVQPFDETVLGGELRSIFWKGKHLGSINKVPLDGSYLSNIAQGAKFHKFDIKKEIQSQCEKLCMDLLDDGIELVAFDILGGNISEVNITCPGLLVEVSHAHQLNLAEKLS